MSRLYDLSVPLRPAGMEGRDVIREAVDHEESARVFARRHGLRVSQLPGGTFFTEERMSLGSHDGTHLDAPYHFYPTSEGRPARFIDQVPLPWCFGDALVLDFRHKKPTEYITEHDVASELERLGRSPKPGNIVINRTGGTDGFETDPRFNQAAAGMNSGALSYLFSLGTVVMGVDSATIDMPIALMTERLLKGDQAAYFPIHRAGRLKEWTHAEKLAHLERLPGPYGFHVMLFPVRIARATGAWIRAVAVEDEALGQPGLELVDLSLPIMNASFEPQPSRIVTSHHEESRRARAKRLGIRVEDMPHLGAMDHVHTYTQAGTHVCAPFHFSPTVDGAPARTVDQVPLEWFYGDGLLLDFSRRPPSAGGISLAEMRRELERSGRAPRERDIVLIRTGAADGFMDDPAWADRGPGLEAEAFGWLLDQGVRVVGCDSESIDGPVAPMVAALRDGRAERFFPIQRMARRREFCLVHKMDLSGLVGRRGGFKVAAFPIRLEGCGAAWTRAVALCQGNGGA